MHGLAREAAFRPFFLDTERGQRFCIYHPGREVRRGAVLYVPPFGEEMNKSRRMAALQSRMLAACGYCVLQIDLYGCGDSDGELRDATWDLWRSDLGAAVRWLKCQVDTPLYLWGLRLGALLALDYARASGERFGGYLLWQPVVSGEAHLTQFLRMRMAAGLTGSAEEANTGALRRALASGATLEIGGYEIGPALAAAFDALTLATLAPQDGSVRWLELIAGEGGGMSRASRRVVDAWTAAGIDLDVQEVVGETFWNTVELVETPALLAATAAAFAAVAA